jgi:hypothetical protein
MAWIYLAESVDSVSPWNHGSGQSPIVKSTDIANPSWLAEWKRINSLEHQSGTILQVSKVDICRKSISFTAASPVRILALQGLRQAWMASEASYFLKSHDWLASSDRNSCSWKMCQLSLLRGIDDGISPKTHRLRALGNSVVPLQAREAFKRLMGLKCT